MRPALFYAYDSFRAKDERVANESRTSGRNASRAAWAAAGVSFLCCVTWMCSAWAYPLDLVVSFQHWLVLCSVLVMVLLVWSRRWAPVGLCGLGIVVGGWPLVTGRAVSVPGVDVLRPPEAGVLRVVSFNIGPLNARWQEDLDRVLGWHADVLVVIEVPPDLTRSLRRGLLDGQGWHWAHRSWVDGYASPCYVFSRWPLERLIPEGVEHAERDILLTRVDADAGTVLVSALHPHSPRTPARWRLGNEIHARTLDAVTGEAWAKGLPLVVAGDLNAGPAGLRARSMRGHGLRAGKPLTGGWGSFDAAWPGPLRLQLDDVWTGPGARVAAWSSLAPLGSDHRIIVVDIRLDD